MVDFNYCLTFTPNFPYHRLIMSDHDQDADYQDNSVCTSQAHDDQEALDMEIRRMVKALEKQNQMLARKLKRIAEGSEKKEFKK